MRGRPRLVLHCTIARPPPRAIGSLMGGGRAETERRAWPIASRWTKTAHVHLKRFASECRSRRRSRPHVIPAPLASEASSGTRPGPRQLTACFRVRACETMQAGPRADEADAVSREEPLRVHPRKPAQWHALHRRDERLVPARRSPQTESDRGLHQEISRTPARLLRDASDHGWQPSGARSSSRNGAAPGRSG